QRTIRQIQIQGGFLHIRILSATALQSGLQCGCERYAGRLTGRQHEQDMGAFFQRFFVGGKDVLYDLYGHGTPVDFYLNFYLVLNSIARVPAAGKAPPNLTNSAKNANIATFWTALAS